jgi:hypothetical protein
MAKANKSEDKGEAKSTKAKPAAEGVAKKPAAKPKAGAAAAKSGVGKAAVSKAARGGGGGSSSTPMIDTNLAASSAAKMLTAGIQGRNAAAGAGAGGGKPQSAMFKQMKDGLSKPHLSGMNNLLDKSAPTGSKRPDQPKGPQQIGHNQTFGADVNRAGVPRRTPG